MKKIMKRSIALVIAVILAFSSIPFAFAEEGYIMTSEMRGHYNEADIMCPVVSLKQKSGGKELRSVKNTYDDNGLLIKSVVKTDEVSATETCEYDSSLRLVKKTSTAKSYGVKLSVKDTYEYDSEGRLVAIKEKMSGYMSSGEEYYCEYDKNGNVVKETLRDDDDESVNEYTYDKKGRLTEEKHTDKSGTDVETYAYSKKGDLSKWTYTDKKGKLKESNTYETTYDKKGRVTSTVTKNIKGKTVSSHTYEYDSKGNVIKEVRQGSDIIKTTYTYTYDKSGRPLKVVAKDKNGNVTDTYAYYSDGTLKEYKSVNSRNGNVETKSYDSKGRITKETQKSDMENIAYTYTYDKSGKLTKQVLSDGGKAVETSTYAYAANGRTKSKTVKFSGGATNTYTYDTTDRGEVVYTDDYGYSFRLSKSSYVCDGKEKKPTVIINNGETVFLPLKINIKYSDNVNAGVGKATITLGGGYEEDEPIVLSFTLTPKAPKSLKATKTEKTKVTLSWESGKGAGKYSVYKSTDGKTWTKAGSTAKTSYTVSGLKSGTSYKFKVLSYDASGSVKGKYSGTVTVKTK